MAIKIILLPELPAAVPSATLDLLNGRIEDSLDEGRLVRMSERAARDFAAVCPVPIFFSAETHRRHVALTEAAREERMDVNGREWDVLSMFRFSAATANARGPWQHRGVALGFEVLGVVDQRRQVLSTLFAHPVFDQEHGDCFVITTAPEALGEVGAAVDTLARLQAPASPLDEEEDADACA